MNVLNHKRPVRFVALGTATIATSLLLAGQSSSEEGSHIVLLRPGTSETVVQSEQSSSAVIVVGHGGGVATGQNGSTLALGGAVDGSVNQGTELDADVWVLR